MQGFEDLKHSHHRHNSTASVQFVLAHCLIGYFVDEVCMPYAEYPTMIILHRNNFYHGHVNLKVRMKRSVTSFPSTFFNLVQTV